MIPRPVVSPTVIGTVISVPGDALTFGRATVTGGVPVAVAVAVAVFVGVLVAVNVAVDVAVGPKVPVGVGVGVLVRVGVFVAVFVAVKVGVPDGDAPPLTVKIPFAVNAGGSPSFHVNPEWGIWPGSV